MEPFYILVLTIGAAVYFLPTIVAIARGKLSGAGVMIMNFVLGWTVIGWVVCFIWAFTGRTKADERRDEERHREVLAMMAKRH